MNSSFAQGEDAAPPSLARVVRVSLLVGWFVGTGLTFYGFPHALLHDEWEDHGWRVDAATRALKLGPFLYFGPLIVASIVGCVAHRRKWDTEGFVQRANLLRRARAPLAVLKLVAHGAIVGVCVLFFTVVNSG